MKTENPYVKPKVLLMQELDLRMENGKKTKEEIELINFISEKIEHYEYLCREYTQDILEELHSGLYDKETKLNEVRSKANYPSLNKQYRACIDLHRDAKRFANRVLEAKREIIREINAKRKRNERNKNQPQNGI